MHEFGSRFLEFGDSGSRARGASFSGKELELQRPWPGMAMSRDV